VDTASNCGKKQVISAWIVSSRQIKITAHGFRSTLTDWGRANEKPESWVREQLDHLTRGKVDQAYGHDDQRRGMMKEYDAFASRPTPEPVADNVIPYQQRKAR
jgi:integrase